VHSDNTEESGTGPFLIVSSHRSRHGARLAGPETSNISVDIPALAGNIGRYLGPFVHHLLAFQVFLRQAAALIQAFEEKCCRANIRKSST
jgi:hypothetical protein